MPRYVTHRNILFHVQWLNRQLQSIASDSVQNYLLQSLTKLLQQDRDYKYFGKVIGIILSSYFLHDTVSSFCLHIYSNFFLGILMEALQSLLENVDVSEHLHICVDPLVLISQSYPQVLCISCFFLIFPP